ncbi:ABC transporter ATP-binding protein [Marinitoga sp. 1155]|uniref:ABC transporter ATP-binding protein n=1 Tax=Marinitoga sp. 1155 TaxID=1428448 RepID=UPI000641816C|nr:ABC transporter ATP-binding protein [Marinitoga sp. 1155]KLO22470.1 branched-chain amino acid ABC transporter ATP-binding protein [Marinitoga sp. 1155]
MLEIVDISVKFGGLVAVKNMNIKIEKGKIHSLIGPNGAGKTTLFNVITGVVKPINGKVVYKNKNLLDLKPEKIIYEGITRTFQNLQLFNFLNVYENIYTGIAYNFKGDIKQILSGESKKFDEEIKIKILEISELLGLKNRLSSYPSQLPYGVLKRIEIARAIVSEPELILFDEPAAGLNSQETLEIEDIFKLINKEKQITILLVEHDMSLVMKISDKITVMNFGEKIAEGTPEEIANNTQVIKVYLGETENV